MALTLTIADVRPLNGAIVRPYTLGAPANLGDAVYIDSNNEIHPADASEHTKHYAIGIIVGVVGGDYRTSFEDGDTVGVCVLGPIAGFTGLDNTKAVWVDASTAGDLTQTKPGGGNYAMAIGRPSGTDILIVNPQTEPAAS